MSIKISSIQGISAMSVNPINRWFRTNPDTDRNPLSFLPHTFQGTVAGYVCNGYEINKFPFATDANATDVGNLSVIRSDTSGQSSEVSGYNSGGFYSPTTQNVIDKFPFASNGNATDVGDLTVARWGTAGQSSNVSGYSSGGYSATPPVPVRFRTTIDKFSFATDASATNIGALTVGRREAAGQSSTVSGYTSGGLRAPQPSPAIPQFLVNVIDKFPFATDAGATDVGDLTVLPYQQAGQSSDVSGYTSGGNARASPGLPAPTNPITRRNIIEKFPFATNANATDIADLTVTRSSVSGQSSTLSGYTSGGIVPGAVASNVIDKFPFATDANATDVGDLTITLYASAGQQD